MQDYKIYLVTLAISILTVLDISSKDFNKIGGMYLSLPCVQPLPCHRIIYLALGVIVSVLFGCTWRWLWCGQMVTAVMNASLSTDPTLANLDRAAKDHAYATGALKRKLLWGIAAFDSWRSKIAFALICIGVFAFFSYVAIPWFVAQIHF